jgi:ribosome-associated protein
MTSKETVDLAAKIALDKKALRVLSVNLSGQSDLCDQMLICSAQNTTQATAICDAISEELKKKHSILPLATEGRQLAQWILLDYGGAIVHIFVDQLRDYYALERIWPKAEVQTYT